MKYVNYTKGKIQAALVVSLLLFISNNFSAQPVNFQWAKQFSNGQENPRGQSIVTDASGNVYTAGIFDGVIDFDPGPGTYFLGPFGPGPEVFVSKLDANGNFMWAKAMGYSAYFERASIALDATANVYITGSFWNPADFDPGPPVFNLTSFGNSDIFVSKLDANGNFLWAKQMGGTGADNSLSIFVDAAGNIFTAGTFAGTADFDPGPAAFNFTASGTQDIYLSKLDANGGFLWAKQIRNSLNGKGNSIKVSALGNIYLAGTFTGTSDFDPGAGTFNLTSTSLTTIDGYFSKYDPNGNFIWAKQLKGSSWMDNSNATSIAVDPLDNVYITGWFKGNIDFDPGNGVYNLGTGITSDIFVSKFDAAGNFVWAKQMGNFSDDIGYSIAVDGAGNVYTAGIFRGTVDFDPGAGINSFLAFGGEDIFISKLNTTGNFAWAKQLGGTAQERAYAITVDAAGNIYTTGDFEATVDFDPGPGIYNLSAVNIYSNIYVHKMSRCTNTTTSSLNVTACDSYSLNNQTYTSGGVYTQSFINAEGCDSILTLNLIIHPRKFTTVNASICQGQSYFAGGSNQTITGVYKDTLLTQFGCDSIITTDLLVNLKPTPNLGPDKNLCFGEPLILNPGTFNTYLWHDLSTSPAFVTTNTGIFWVTVTDNNNCSAVDTIKILNVVLPPSNFLKAVDSVCQYDPLQIEVSNSYTNYLWSTGSTQFFTFVVIPGQYTLTVTDLNGCMGIDTIQVYPRKCSSGIFIPTAFTPNGDQLNDVFKAKVYGPVISFSLEVYDRSGQLIFKTTDSSKGWNGMYGGIPSQTAVYVWQCFYQLEGGKPSYQKGTVTIIR